MCFFEPKPLKQLQAVVKKKKKINTSIGIWWIAGMSQTFQPSSMQTRCWFGGVRPDCSLSFNCGFFFFFGLWTRSSADRRSITGLQFCCLAVAFLAAFSAFLSLRLSFTAGWLYNNSSGSATSCKSTVQSDGCDQIRAWIQLPPKAACVLVPCLLSSVTEAAAC